MPLSLLFLLLLYLFVKTFERVQSLVVLVLGKLPDIFFLFNVSLILIMIFAEALALYGFIIAIVLVVSYFIVLVKNS